MQHLTQRIEGGFGAFAHFVFRRPLRIIGVVFLLLALVLSQLPRTTIDPSTEGLFRPDDPKLLAYQAFQERFGRDEQIIIALKPRRVFEPAFLEKLRTYHRALEAEVPLLKAVDSLVNARITEGRGDELIVRELMADWPETPEAIEAIRKTVAANPLFQNLLISEDGRFTAVTIRTRAFSPAGEPAALESGFDQAPAAEPAGPRPRLTDEENARIVAAIEKVNARFQGPDFPILTAGSPVVTDYLKRAMEQNMALFLALAVLAISFFLFVLFRRLSGVVFPLVIVLLTLATTIGLMTLFGAPLKLPTMILPSFLLAVGVGGSVHILAIFYHRFDQGAGKEQAMVFALSHSGLPVVMTSLTTAAGLGSFATAPLAAVADLGRFAAGGVLVAMVLTLALLPAFLALVPLRPRPAAAGGHNPWMDGLLGWLADFSVRRAGAVAVVSLLLMAVAGAGVFRLVFSHNTLLWFPKDDPLRVASDTIDRELKGSLTMEFVFDTGRENGVQEPGFLNRMEAFVAETAHFSALPDGKPWLGKTISLVDVVKEINQALNENQPAAYRIPQSRPAIAQELLLFENAGTDDLEDLVDSQFSVTHLTAKGPWRDAATFVDMVDRMERRVKDLFRGVAGVEVTGLTVLFTHSVDAMMRTTQVSYVIAGAVITLLMILLLGSVRLGLLSMIPNLMPIIMTMGFMGWVGIPLDMFTLLIGSIAIGLAVDDTIHFMHNFVRYYRRGGEAGPAVRETLLTTGRAMVVTTVVLVAGFWLFMFASLNNLFLFGLLTGITLALALLADLLVGPAMMTLVTRRWRLGLPRG